MSRVARHVRITGRVQGVFFRQWTAEQARALGIVGWVRNCADGSVEAHLEGQEAAVMQFLKQLHRGPPAARVTEVIAEDAVPQDCAGFEVRR
jgi:acylphosphatase